MWPIGATPGTHDGFEGMSTPAEHEIFHSFGKPFMMRTFGLLEQLEHLKSLELNLSMLEKWGFADDVSLLPPCGDTAFRTVSLLADLNLPSLQSLDLDLAYPRYITLSYGAFRSVIVRAGGDHTCRAINRLMCRFDQLKYFQLKLPFICPKILAERPPDGTLALETFHVQWGMSLGSGWLRRGYQCKLHRYPTSRQVGWDFQQAQKILNGEAAGIATAIKNFLPRMAQE